MIAVVERHYSKAIISRVSMYFSVLIWLLDEDEVSRQRFNQGVCGHGQYKLRIRENAPPSLTIGFSVLEPRRSLGLLHGQLSDVS